MDKNPEGTPNPLNPVQGVKPVEPNPGMATGTGMLDYSEPMVVGSSSTATKSSQVNTSAPADVAGGFSKPNSASFTKPAGASFAKPVSASFTKPVNEANNPRPANTSGFTRPTGNIDGFARPNGTAGNHNNHPMGIDGFSQPSPRAAHAAVDPMMRPAGTHANTEARHDNFETLEANDGVAGIAQPPKLNQAEMPELTAKDSIVEPTGKHGGKKKPLVIGAIMLIVIAVICGATAIVMAVMNTGGDKVSRAVEKLLSGQVSNLIGVDGNINVTPDAEDATALISSANIKFNGAFDTTSALNKVTATVSGTLANGGNLSLDITELTNKSGNTFFRISGLDTILPAMTAVAAITTPTSPDLVTSTNPVVEIEMPTTTNGTTNETTDPAMLELMQTDSGTATMAMGLLSVYSGLIEAADDQWILVSDDFSSNMGGLELFDNPTTCVINSFKSLGEYSSEIAKKYKENPFITYSTEKLAISKKKNDLYRLGIDETKLKAFENSLSGNGFLKAISSCYADGTASTFTLSGLLDLPTMYAEIDNNYNFTRFYFEADEATLDSASTAMITADLSLSYPAKIEIVEPESYINMSTLLSNVMTKLLSDSGNAATENK